MYCFAMLSFNTRAFIKIAMKGKTKTERGSILNYKTLPPCKPLVNHLIYVSACG